MAERVGLKTNSRFSHIYFKTDACVQNRIFSFPIVDGNNEALKETW